MLALKVSKCDIFDGLDWHNFYTIKSFWGDDFGAKYKLVIIIFGGAWYHLISDAQASVPYAYAQHGLKGPIQI
jgi:hypothetical protein